MKNARICDILQSLVTLRLLHPESSLNIFLPFRFPLYLIGYPKIIGGAYCPMSRYGRDVVLGHVKLTDAYPFLDGLIFTSASRFTSILSESANAISDQVAHRPGEPLLVLPLECSRRLRSKPPVVRSDQRLYDEWRVEDMADNLWKHVLIISDPKVINFNLYLITQKTLCEATKRNTDPNLMTIRHSLCQLRRSDCSMDFILSTIR